MKSVKIEKDIPVPRMRSKYPYATMEVGDSFLVPNPYFGKTGHVRSYLPRKDQKFVGKFTQRLTPEGLRVWRIE